MKEHLGFNVEDVPDEDTMRRGSSGIPGSVVNEFYRRGPRGEFGQAIIHCTMCDQEILLALDAQRGNVVTLEKAPRPYLGDSSTVQGRPTGQFSVRVVENKLMASWWGSAGGDYRKHVCPMGGTQ